MDSLYTLENALKFEWASITGKLLTSRTSLLESQLLGSRILDAGCSGGGYSEFVARQNRRVVGIDKFGDFLNLAPRENRKAVYVQGDITALPFTNNCFDSSYCFDVLEHVDDIATLSELARVTGRRLILVVPHENQLLAQWGLTFYHYSDRTHLRYYNEVSLREAISSISYSKVSIVPDCPIQWGEVFRTVVEDVPTNLLASMLDPGIVLRVMKYMTQDLIGSGSVSLKASYLRARKNRFLKQVSQMAFKQLHTELIAIIDLAPS